MAVMQGVLQAGSDVPLDSHADPGCFYLLAGRMEIYRDVKQPAGWNAVQAGEFAATYPNAKHAWRHQGSEACGWLTVAGAEVFRFLSEACQLQAESAAGNMFDEAVHAELASGHPFLLWPRSSPRRMPVEAICRTCHSSTRGKHNSTSLTHAKGVNA